MVLAFFHRKKSGTADFLKFSRKQTDQNKLCSAEYRSQIIFCLT